MPGCQPDEDAQHIVAKPSSPRLLMPSRPLSDIQENWEDRENAPPAATWTPLAKHLPADGTAAPSDGEVASNTPVRKTARKDSEYSGVSGCIFTTGGSTTSAGVSECGESTERTALAEARPVASLSTNAGAVPGTPASPVAAEASKHSEVNVRPDKGDAAAFDQLLQTEARTASPAGAAQAQARQPTPPARHTAETSATSQLALRENDTSRTSLIRPDWAAPDESTLDGQQSARDSLRGARTPATRRLSGGVRTTKSRMQHRRSSTAANTQLPVPRMVTNEDKSEAGVPASGQGSGAEPRALQQDTSPAQLPSSERAAGTQGAQRLPATTFPWNANGTIQAAEATRAFEEYRASVAVQLDAAERLVERYKSENEQLRQQLDHAEVAKLRQRVDDLERTRTDQQLRYLELQKHAIQLEADLARERLALERERSQLAQLENDAAPAAALFQLCSGATQVKPIRVRYESTGTTPETEAKLPGNTPSTANRPQAIWLNGYQILLENSALQRRALFQLVLDDSGDVEYTPLELMLGDAATDAPDFLQETIYFPRNELPLFWLRLVGVLF
jgi:hypothetical protein